MIRVSKSEYDKRPASERFVRDVEDSGKVTRTFFVSRGKHGKSIRNSALGGVSKVQSKGGKVVQEKRKIRSSTLRTKQAGN